MQLYYDTQINGESYTLCPEQSHHAVVVMRRAVGDRLNVCDGRGHLYVCRVVVADKRAAQVEIESVSDFGEVATVHLVLAPTKNIERTEWAVEKAVEIGVARITPIICERSERKTLRIDRLQRIVTSAAEQSLKGYLPMLDEPMTFGQFVEEFEGGFIAHCNEGEKISLPRAQGDARIMIGPEGDFSPAEVSRAIERGYRAVTLGNSRLRTETAAVCAIALLATINCQL